MKNSFLIDNNNINSRLDRWFKRNVCNVPQSLIEKHIRKGNIKINKKIEKSSYKLKKNDKIFIYNINFIPDQNKKKTNLYIPSKKELDKSERIFIEDNENFVVLNKPQGIAVQPGTKSRRNILDILRKTKEFNSTSPYIVHRIDKETSGILIVAKNRKYAQLFTSLFRIRKIHKTYLGIVIGEFKDKEGVYTDELFHYEGKKKIITKAITYYKVIDANNNFTLIKLNPKTGRKHQLRKQLLIHGHPIIGDEKYRILTKYNPKKQTLMLHSYKINFLINNIKYNFVAKPPLNFTKFLAEKNLKIPL
tara:strand:+ start:253 stop:1167 length:915 start_codon:yes stop_codon:yes gene_type:complete